MQKLQNNEIPIENQLWSEVKLPREFDISDPFLNKDFYQYDEMTQLEDMSHICDAYMQLNYNFPQSFIHTKQCEQVKERCF